MGHRCSALQPPSKTGEPLTVWFSVSSTRDKCPRFWLGADDSERQRPQSIHTRGSTSSHNFQFPEAAGVRRRPESDAVWCPGFTCNNWILPGPLGGLDFSCRSNIIWLFCCCLFYKADVLISLMTLWALQYFQWLPFLLKLPKLFVSCIHVPWLIPWLRQRQQWHEQVGRVLRQGKCVKGQGVRRNPKCCWLAYRLKIPLLLICSSSIRKAQTELFFTIRTFSEQFHSIQNLNAWLWVWDQHIYTIVYKTVTNQDPLYSTLDYTQYLIICYIWREGK